MPHIYLVIAHVLPALLPACREAEVHQEQALVAAAACGTQQEVLRLQGSLGVGG